MHSEMKNRKLRQLKYRVIDRNVLCTLPVLSAFLGLPFKHFGNQDALKGRHEDQHWSKNTSTDLRLRTTWKKENRVNLVTGILPCTNIRPASYEVRVTPKVTTTHSCLFRTFLKLFQSPEPPPAQLQQLCHSTKPWAGVWSGGQWTFVTVCITSEEGESPLTPLCLTLYSHPTVRCPLI